MDYILAGDEDTKTIPQDNSADCIQVSMHSTYPSVLADLQALGILKKPMMEEKIPLGFLCF